MRVSDDELWSAERCASDVAVYYTTSLSGRCLFGEWFLDYPALSVPHRHIILSIPKFIRRCFLFDRKLVIAPGDPFSCSF